MTTFTLAPVAGLADDSTHSAALGVSAGTKLTDADIGKAVKLIADSTFGLCASGNDIEGVLIAVEPATVNAGFGFGTIQRKEFIIGINKTAAAAVLAIGDYVVAGDQTAVGTTLTPIASGTQTGVKGTPVIAGAGAIFRWRVVAHLGGAGATNTAVLLEKVV
jgi:hypothetical protein